MLSTVDSSEILIDRRYLGEVGEGCVVVQDIRQTDLRTRQHVDLMLAVVHALLKTRKVPDEANTHSQLHIND